MPTVRTWRVDLHVHTTYSDAMSTPHQVLLQAQQFRLDAIAITDHDTIKGALDAQAMAIADPTLPQIIIGEEISSQEGHILGLFLSSPIPPGLSALATIQAIHAQDGLAVAAHPFWRYPTHAVGGGNALRLPFDGIEVLNGAPAPSMLRANRRAQMLQFPHRARTGGSDAHHALAVGSACTTFQGESLQDLKKTMRSQATQPLAVHLSPLALLRYGWLGFWRDPKAVLRAIL